MRSLNGTLKTIKFRNSLGPNDGLDVLRTLVRGELAAVESYRRALLDPEVRGQSSAIALKQIAHEHAAFADVLAAFIPEGKAKPATSGPWGVYAKAVTATAQLMGKIVLFNALKEGEELGLNRYEHALDWELDPRVTLLIRTTLIPKTRSHIPLITRMVESEIYSGFMER